MFFKNTSNTFFSKKKLLFLFLFILLVSLLVGLRSGARQDLLYISARHFKNKVFNNISLKSYGDVTKEILFYEKRQEEFIKILEKAKNLTESNNSNFYLVYLPTHQRYLSNVGSIMHDFKFDIYPKIKKISKDLDLNFIDLHKDFLEKQENYNELLPLGIDGHFNINGYKKITEFIYNSIKKIN